MYATQIIQQVILDEAYFEYAIHDPQYIDGLEILKERPNTIILRTFSKVAGLASLDDEEHIRNTVDKWRMKSY